MKEGVLQRFESKIFFGSPDGCWYWTDCINKLGYGLFRIGGRKSGNTFLAHRISYELYKEKIQNDLCVLHNCDNPRCVNPDHLFLGTRDDNNKDKVKKGRQAFVRGEQSGMSKLKDSDIREIRKQGGKRTIVEIGKSFGVTHRIISLILRNKAWTHVL